jgi:sugar phosphate isomerase/epimerase
MRLGGPVFEKSLSPDSWAAAVKKLGYSAAYCPVGHDAPDELVKSFAAAAKKEDIVIAEVGAWSNPLSPDEAKRSEALALCRNQLALADRIGARCCVNISGSRGAQWDGPHPDNLTPATFDLVVQTVRSIIDAVKPKRSFFTLETMPWMFPDSAESYRKLLKAVRRKQFAVHFDPVNLICSPQRYYDTAGLIRDFVTKLGKHIKSCHAKDVILHPKLTTHLDEVRPGLGGLDYAAYLSAVAKLDDDLPVMLEHLHTAEAYEEAAKYLRSAAAKAGVRLR